MISIQEAKQHLRIDGNFDDPWLNIWIPVVWAAVANWLKQPWRLYVWETDENGKVVYGPDGTPTLKLDAEGEFIENAMVKGAQLIELAQQYTHRDGTGVPQAPDQSGWGYTLGPGATALLRGLRAPTVSR